MLDTYESILIHKTPGNTLNADEGTVPNSELYSLHITHKHCLFMAYKIQWAILVCNNTGSPTGLVLFRHSGVYKRSKLLS